MKDISTTFRIAINIGRERIWEILKEKYKELLPLPKECKSFILKDNNVLFRYNKDFDKEKAVSHEDGYLYYEHYLDFYPKKRGDLDVGIQIIFAEELIKIFREKDVKVEVIAEFEHLLNNMRPKK